MKRSKQDFQRHSDEAAYWVVRLKHDASPETQTEFDKWLRHGGPRRFDEFWKAHLSWTSLDRLDATYNLGTADSSSCVVDFPDTGSDDLSVVSFAPESAPGSKVQRPAIRRRYAVGLGIAASILMATAAVLMLTLWPFGYQSYATTVGGQQSIKLSDGSVIQLNTHSRVKVRFTDHAREIRLDDGEALFTVAHDTSRPFIVVTDNARVRAVGTQFNVYRAGVGATRVSVLDGIVQITTAAPDTRQAAPASTTAAQVPFATKVPSAGGSASQPLQLAAGDEAVVHKGTVERAAASDPQRTVAWLDRKLVFNSDRIDFIAEQFNRYNERKILVEGSVAERRMGGTFDVDDPTPILLYLSSDPHVEVLQTQTQILIRPRQAGEAIR